MIDRHGKLDENDAFDDDQDYGLGGDDDHVAIPKVSQKRQMPGGRTNDWVEEFLSIGPMTGKGSHHNDDGIVRLMMMRTMR